MDMSHARLSLFGIIKILEEMKALSSSFAEGRPTVDGGLLHHTLAYGSAVRQDCSFLGRMRQKQSLAKEPSMLKYLACSFHNPA
jgi:hypothetical protein